MKYLFRLLASFYRRFRLFVNIIVHIATVGFAGCALFLLGFYVIPVFAEKAPLVVSELSQAKAPISIESDQDHDGLSDSLEQKIGSEVLLSDTDGDGVVDGLEVSLKKKKSLITTKMVAPTS